MLFISYIFWVRIIKVVDIINNFLTWFEKSTNIYIYIFLAISSKSRFETRISIYNILKEEITFNCHFFYLQSILDKKKRKRRISNKNILFTYIAFDYPLTKKKKLLQSLLHEHKRFDSGFALRMILLVASIPLFIYTLIFARGI